MVEAMGCGLQPIVIDYGVPADLVSSGRGFKVAMTPSEDLLQSFREQMETVTRSTDTDTHRAGAQRRGCSRDRELQVDEGG